MRFALHIASFGLCAVSLTSTPCALATPVEVNLYGTVTSGSTITGQTFTGQSVRVSFSYDTATPGTGGVFSGGVNFLNPALYLNGIRYISFTDELAPVHPTTITVVDGTPDSLALDFDVEGYVGITSRTESLSLSFAAATNFLNDVAALPASADVFGSGSGSFSLLYVDDCQNYACGPSGVFAAGASFTIDRLQISPSPVPEPSPAALWLVGSLALWAGLRHRTRR